MNLNMKIKDLWANDVTLNALCKVDRLFFEEKTEEDRVTNQPEYPYAVWITLDDTPAETTSEAFYDEALYNLVIYSDDYDEAENLQRESRRLLRSAVVDPDTDGTVVLFERRGGSLGGEEGSVYMALDEYAVLRQRSR